MGKYWIPLLSALFLVESAGGQSLLDDELDPLFQSWGATTFIDVIRGPATVFQDNSGTEHAYQTDGFSYLTAAYRGRMNLAEFFDDMALSSSLTPAVGLSFFRSGYLHFNLPAVLHLEIGAAATKNANIERFGLVGGIGYEFHAAPIIVNRSDLALPSDTKLENTWLQPVYSLGVRYERGGQLIELSVKYGEGRGTFAGGKQIRPRTIRVMAFYFI